jgi:hypothetical protein
MSSAFCTPQGAINTVFCRFLAPSGCPFIYIYQAGAQRTIGAVVPERLIHCIQGSRTTSGPLHRLHPSNMSQIAPFDLAGRALHTGDTTSRVTDRHGAHPLRPTHPVHDVHHLRPMQNHTTRNA